MSRDLAARASNALLIPLAIFVLPLVGAPAALIEPAPWIGFMAGVATQLTQPLIGLRQMLHCRSDRYSALCLFLGVSVPLLGATLDFAYIRGGTTRLGPLVLGMLLALGGMSLRLWSIRTLGKCFTSTVEVMPEQPVVDSGPYRLVRHPSYTGTLLTWTGVAVSMSSGLGVLLIVLLTLPAYLYRIKVEERELARLLGNGYRSYAARTWRLVPFVF